MYKYYFWRWVYYVTQLIDSALAVLTLGFYNPRLVVYSLAKWTKIDLDIGRDKMYKLRVRAFLLSWAYHWVQLVDALLGIASLGLFDKDLAGRIVVHRWFESHDLIWEGSESWDDSDEWLPEELWEPSDSDGPSSIDITIFE